MAALSARLAAAACTCMRHAMCQVCTYGMHEPTCRRAYDTHGQSHVLLHRQLPDGPPIIAVCAIDQDYWSMLHC